LAGSVSQQSLRDGREVTSILLGFDPKDAKIFPFMMNQGMRPRGEVAKELVKIFLTYFRGHGVKEFETLSLNHISGPEFFKNVFSKMGLIWGQNSGIGYLEGHEIIYAKLSAGNDASRSEARTDGPEEAGRVGSTAGEEARSTVARRELSSILKKMKEKDLAF
jgi:hypothetical protein